MKNVNELLGFPTFQRDMKNVDENSEVGFPLFRVAVLALAGGGTSGHSVAMEGQTDPTKSRYLNINENCLGGHNHL